ncbi:MAG: hypothetical protein ACJAZI_000235 [Cycloclasticus sp.]|jgi:hypothetical protein
MKLNKFLAGISFVAATLITAPVVAETNRALEAWKAFAAEQKKPNYDKWVELISDPKAIALAKEWKDLRGYDAYDLIDKANLPADLKPGLVITAENKANYPWLKDYLTKELYDAIGGSWGYINKIKIVPTNTYYMHEGYLKNTKELKEKNININFDADGQMVYDDGSYALLSGAGASSIPFINPKNGLELNWNLVASSVATETLEFNPVYLNSCTAEGKPEREYKAHLWWWHFHNRTQIEPFGDIPGKEQMVEGGSIFFLEPNDVRGLAGVRQRYAAANREDDFKVFIPSLRRTRLLTGSDSEDPLASGLELSWDDWRSYWVKTNIVKFEYKLISDAFILAPVSSLHAYDSVVLTDDKCGVDYMEVEIRPTWLLEINDKSGKYQYSKRHAWVDKEFYNTRRHITWGPRGNIFKSYDENRDWKPSTGEGSWGRIMVRNNVTHRTTTMRMTATWKDLDVAVDESMFDVDQLRDYR